MKMDNKLQNGISFCIHELIWHIQDMVKVLHKGGVRFFKMYSHFPSIGNTLHKLHATNIEYMLQTHI